MEVAPLPVAPAALAVDKDNIDAPTKSKGPSTQNRKHRQRSPSVIKISPPKPKHEVSDISAQPVAQPASPPPQYSATPDAVKSESSENSSEEDEAQTDKTKIDDDDEEEEKVECQDIATPHVTPSLIAEPTASPAFIQLNTASDRGPSEGNRNESKRSRVLHSLEHSSPNVSPKPIHKNPNRRSWGSPTLVKAPYSPSTQSVSTASSGYRDDLFDTASIHGTTGSTSPGYKHNTTYGIPSVSSKGSRRGSTARPVQRNPNQQHPMSPRAGQPIYTVHSPGGFNNYMHHDGHPPLNDCRPLPPSGYNLLSVRLAQRFPDEHGPPIQPIYRRFEALNHRILLHLQDEIAQLEEQLHELDRVDTQHRQPLHGPIVPESRRSENLHGADLYRDRNDILGSIGMKLQLYNNVLKSFQNTQGFPTPARGDVQDYRAFLSVWTPIAESERHFLDSFDDLVCLGYSTDRIEAIHNEGNVETPMQQNDFAVFHNGDRPSSTRRQSVASGDAEISSAGWADNGDSTRKLVAALGAMAASVLVPVVAFLIVPSFVGRLIVALLVGAGVLAALINARFAELPHGQELLVLVGFYGSVMSILAAVVA